MKETVTYSCGHKGLIEVWGSQAERDRKIYACENGLCPECAKKQQQEEIEAQIQELGLITLQGSEKQIEWANKIRFEKIKFLISHNPATKDSIKIFSADKEKFAKYKSNIQAVAEKYNGNAEFELAKQMIKIIEEQTATWYIDNK